LERQFENLERHSLTRLAHDVRSTRLAFKSAAPVVVKGWPAVVKK
jgi:hypothetical protein